MKDGAVPLGMVKASVKLRYCSTGTGMVDEATTTSSRRNSRDAGWADELVVIGAGFELPDGFAK